MATTAPRKGKKAPASKRSKADTAAGIARLLALLDERWPEATPELDWQTPLQLLVATILSAQCTDERVNRVTPELFSRFPDAGALAGADQGELERLVHSTGFFRNKAKALKGAALALVERHGGELPREMAAMTALPGVARKTANLVLGTAFGLATGVVVDTHVKRTAARLGLTAETDPAKVERDLMALAPERRWIRLGHQLILHGRYTCKARKPDCGACALAPHCPSASAFLGQATE